MKEVLGYALFSVQRVIHGAHIRPYEICKELGVHLAFSKGLHTPPFDLLKAIFRKKVLLVFPGYTADQLSLLLIYLAKLRHCKLILDVADLPYLQYKFFQDEPSGKSQRDFARLVRLSDVLLFSTDSLFVQAAKSLDIAHKPCFTVENAADPLHFKSTPLPSQKVILFVGGYIPARGVDELIEAFRILRKRGVKCKLKLAGFGYPKAFKEEGVEILMDAGYDQIPSVYADSYVFVIPHRPNLYMKIAAPIKLFDAMASGRPVVSTPCDETIKIIEEERCGLITGTAPSSIADAIEYLFENPDAATEMGLRGRTAIEKRHSWKISADRIRDIILKEPRFRDFRDRQLAAPNSQSL